MTDELAIEAFLRTDPALHLYALGDLDPFFRPHTRWHTLDGERGVRAVVLEYSASDPPTLLALEDRDPAAAAELLARTLPDLPPRFYAHVSPHLLEPLGRARSVVSHGEHLKLVLGDRARVLAAAPAPFPVRALGPADLAVARELYAAAYEGNWFDPRMLETGHYLAAFDGPRAVAIAGVHVFSARLRVAALGNVATHPDHRGRGLATALTAALARRLLAEVDAVGLNVKADNTAALRCYERLGFERRARYVELSAET